MDYIAPNPGPNDDVDVALNTWHDQFTAILVYAALSKNANEEETDSPMVD